MTNKLQVIACDTEAKADEAIALLQAQGFPAAATSKEKTTTFVYDGDSFSSGGNDMLDGKWIVIGRT
jgi:hypothetical protein